MIYVIHRKKTALLISALFIATPIFTHATTETAPVKKAPPYGDNPNIFKVIGYKTKEKFENTFSRIGNATERGVDKVKPVAEKTVNKTVDKTVIFAEKTATVAENTAEKTVTGIENTATKAKEAVLGDPNVKAPIEQHTLSAPSSNTEIVVVEPVVVEQPIIINEPATQPVAPAQSSQEHTSDDDSSSIPR